MSDTPRTDECIVVYPEENAYDMYVWADFARKLERENTALRKDKERLDWLEASPSDRLAEARRIVWQQRDTSTAVRAAIDAAMKEGRT